MPTELQDFFQKTRESVDREQAAARRTFSPARSLEAMQRVGDKIARIYPILCTLLPMANYEGLDTSGNSASEWLVWDVVLYMQRLARQTGDEKVARAAQVSAQGLAKSLSDQDKKTTELYPLSRMQEMSASRLVKRATRSTVYQQEFSIDDSSVILRHVAPQARYSPQALRAIGSWHGAESLVAGNMNGLLLAINFLSNREQEYALTPYGAIFAIGSSVIGLMADEYHRNYGGATWYEQNGERFAPILKTMNEIIHRN